jgi:hypothetical protein
MRKGTILAVILFSVAAALFVYSMVLTPRMDMDLPEEGYRPRIQDQSSPEPKKPPLIDSNVPPAGSKG